MRNAEGRRQSTLLLLGPTGSGKTPLGDVLEKQGLWGRAVVHLDFGHQLRSLVAGTWSVDALNEEEVAFVGDVLRQGALFENETFTIPERIIAAFIRDAALPEDGLLVLNGLPRHVDQAADLDGLLHVVLVVHLDCAPETVMERIRLNAGGDRTGREDDDLALVRRKLATFHNRTAPLLDHYATRGVHIARIDVSVRMQPEDMAAQISMN